MTAISYNDWIELAFNLNLCHIFSFIFRNERVLYLPRVVKIRLRERLSLSFGSPEECCYLSY